MGDAQVSFNARRGAIQSQGQSLKGLTRVLQKAFYPNYSFAAARARRSPHDVVAPEPPNVRRIRGSRRVGNGLDRTVGESVKLQLQYSLKFSCFWQVEDAEAAAARISNRSHRAAVLRICRRRNNPYVKLFWQFLQVQRLKPVETQAAVRHPTLRLGTMADVVVVDSEGRHRVLELKTGFETYNCCATRHRLSAPFGQQDDSPANQHQLQLAATSAMYKMSHPSRRCGAPLLLRFHSTGLTCSPLEPWIRSNVVVAQLFTAVQLACFTRSSRPI